MQIYCGIDFGTTNTVVSIANGPGKIVDSFSVPTILFISHHPHEISSVYIGYQALEKYESGAAGRYIHSIKRSLHDPAFVDTLINRQRITLPHLVSFFLNELNKMITHKWGFMPKDIVLGRPVIFSPSEEEDMLARERLLEGFRLAGYEGIRLLEEPVAASLCFEQHLKKDDNRFLIVDFGGGTCDFSVVSQDSEKQGIERYDILATHGINIGGDNFDEDLMFAKLSGSLGSDSTYSSFNRRLGMPVHLYRDISRWNNIHSHDIAGINDDFRDYLYQASNKVGVGKLKSVFINNLSNKILQKVRAAKHELSEKEETMILFNEYGLELAESVSKFDFNNIINGRTNSIIYHIREILLKAELGECDIDRVIFTGGSSRLIHVRQMVGKIFGEDKILVDTDLYNSVSLGLARYAVYNKISVLGR